MPSQDTNIQVLRPTIESFELEGAIKNHLAQLPCNEHEHLQPDQHA